MAQIPFIEGVVAPVFTPMDDAGQINLDIIPEYIKYLKDEKVDTVLVGGTTGEAASLCLPERKLLLDAWLKAAKPFGVRVISQVGGAPMPDVIELAKFSKIAGADAIMTLPELYFKPKTAEQVVIYLEEVYRVAPGLPLIYYHFPMMTGVNVNMKQFVSLVTSKIPTFNGIKADLSVAVEVEVQLAPHQRVFIANHHLAPAFLMGHHSTIATVTNMFPSQVRAIMDAVVSGDVSTAKDKQQALNRAVDVIASYGDFVPAMKAAMEIITGIKVGAPRQPLTRLENSQLTALQENITHII